MRPYPDEILRSMQYSLDTYVIPHVSDKWGSYVAKVMRRMLVHLERRWQLEGPLLVTDTAELRQLLEAMGDRLAALDGPAAGDRAAALLGDIGSALDETAAIPDGYQSVEQLTERNERLREALVGLIEGLDELAATTGEEALAPMREEIHAYLLRQSERDTQLAEPTFMSFAPPPAQGAKSDAAQTA